MTTLNLKLAEKKNAEILEKKETQSYNDNKVDNYVQERVCPFLSPHPEQTRKNMYLN